MKFAVTHKRSAIRIETTDFVHFILQYPNGFNREMLFEFNSDLDLIWFFTTDTIAVTEAQEIGKLIENVLWKL